MKALRGVDSQSMHYQPLHVFTMSSCRDMAKLKTLSVCQKIFFQHQTSSCISSICLQHIYKVLKRSSEISKRSWFHKVCTVNHYLLGAVVRKWLLVKIPNNLSKLFLNIKLLYAHLQYVCNISAKCWKDLKKALGGVDFTKYALSVIIQTPYCKNYKVA